LYVKDLTKLEAQKSALVGDTSVAPSAAKPAPDGVVKRTRRTKAEMEAARAAYELGITSLSRIASDMGRDIEDVFDERQSESALADRYGVTLNAGQPAVVVDPAPN
jgi:hypothetical protein